MADEVKPEKTVAKKRGFIERIQDVGTGLATWYGVEKVTDLFKPEHRAKLTGTFKVFDSIRKVVKSQFGTGLFGFDIKDETNATRARSVLCKRQDGLRKCQVVNLWLAQLKSSDINKFNQVIAEEFVDALTMYTILLEQASTKMNGGEQKPDNNHAPAVNLTAEEVMKFLIDMAKKSEEVMAQLDESAADVLEMYADMSDDQARTNALIAAHLKRPELHLADDDFGEEMLNRAKRFSDNAWAKVKHR